MSANLQYVALRVDQCSRCVLHATRTHPVPGSGNDHAQIMLVGEAPGEQEDLSGNPFVGWAGSILDQALTNTQITRADLYITNVVKCRPPKNRDPLIQELQACARYLMAQILSVQPKVIVALGKYAGNLLAGELAEPIPVYLLREDPGMVFTFGSFSIPLICTYHPSYVGRQIREGNTTPLYQLQADLRKAKHEFCMD